MTYQQLVDGVASGETTSMRAGCLSSKENCVYHNGDKQAVWVADEECWYRCRYGVNLRVLTALEEYEVKIVSEIESSNLKERHFLDDINSKITLVLPRAMENASIIASVKYSQKVLIDDAEALETKIPARIKDFKAVMEKLPKDLVVAQLKERLGRILERGVSYGFSRARKAGMASDNDILSILLKNSDSDLLNAAIIATRISSD